MNRHPPLRRTTVAVSTRWRNDEGTGGVKPNPYERKRFFATKRTLAGRSARRRMYQGNQASP